MAERAIEDGFVDCPKYGVMDELRCLPSKDEDRVVCYFGETPPASAATEDPAAEPETEQAEAAPA